MAIRKPAPKPATKPAPQRPPPLTQERLKELEIFNKMRRGEQLTPEERRAYQLKQRSQVPKPLPEQGTIGAVPPTQERLKELEVFNKMRRGEKLTPEEQRSYQLKQRSQAPLPRPEFRSPINMVRDPRFDSAMANQNFKNSMTEQRARMEADKANRRMTPMPPRGDFTQGRLMGAPVNQSPQPGSALYQDLANQQMQEYQNSLQQSQQGTFESQYQNLANQQMQNYNNLLQQGIQRSNTMNQDAAAGFANLQPGMQPAQPAMPVAGMGMGMQQPRQAPAPRKFSTVNTPSARFG